MTLILQTQPKIINVEHEEIPSYGPKEIQEIKDVILDTVTLMGGDREDIAVKYLKRIASEANCHWKAIQTFLLDEKVSFAIMNNIATAFSAVKVVENDNAEQISNSVDLVSKIFDYDFNAVTVNWFYPKGSKVSLYKNTIRKFVETLTKAHTDYWERDCNLKGDQLDFFPN